MIWLLLFGLIADAVKTLDFEFLGPFLIAKTEIDADPLQSSVHNCSLQQILTKVSGCPTKFPSEVAEGGFAGWMKYSKHGLLPLALREQQTNVVQSLNKLTALEFSGWATTVLHVTEPDLYRIQCRPAHTIFVDGVRYEEDIYSRGLASVAVNLSSGKHHLWVRVRARHSLSFSCTWERVPAHRFVLSRPVTAVSDLLNGKLPMGNVSYVAFNFQNLGFDRLTIIAVDVETAIGPGKPIVRTPLGPEGQKLLPIAHPYAKFVAPLHSVIIPVAFELNHADVTPSWWKQYASSDAPCLSFAVTFKAVAGGNHIVSNTQVVDLRCRSHKQSVVFSHLDADGSVTSAAFVRPHLPCPAHGCPVVLSLCGVGTGARNQADSHKYQQQSGEKTSFVFGYPQAWVLAPFREGAHNGEGTGFWTPFVALRQLLLFANTSFHADLSRVLFVGHSRGGHWAYTLSEHHPSVAVAVMSAGGYGDREEYGDANVLFDLDLQLAFMSPIVKSVLEASIFDHDNHASAGNLKGVDVLVRVGAEDRTVPPFHQRRMFRVLHHKGVNVTFDEVPNKDHWWWDTEQTSDGGVMNDPFTRKFMKDHFSLADERSNSSSSSSGSRKRASEVCVLNERVLSDFEVTAWNPATQGCKGGVTILQMYSQLSKAFCKVRFDTVNHTWQISPSNVRRFRVYGGNNSDSEANVSVVVGSNSFWAAVRGRTEFCHTLNAGWEICKDTNKKPVEIKVPASLTHNITLLQHMWRERTSFTYGPARMVTANPFLTIVGTLNSKAFPRLMDVARGLSMGHHHASLTVAPILLDTELTIDMWKQNPMSLILIGGPGANLWSARAIRTSPVPVRFGSHDSFLSVAGCRWTSRSAIGFTLPLGDEIGLLAADRPHLSFMIAATADDYDRPDTESLLLALTSNTFSSNVPLTRAPFSNLFPDWMVIGDAFPSEGYGGVIGTGFWNSEWGYDASNGFLDPACAALQADVICAA